MSNLDCSCELCAVLDASPERTRSLVGTVLAHAGHDVLVLVRSESREVLVAPTEHIATLDAFSVPKMGALLAVLRRVTTVVQMGEGRVTVDQVEELVGSEGHIRFRVAPAPLHEGAAPFADVEGLVRRLSEVLS
jgi:hypothetical protein